MVLDKNFKPTYDEDNGFPLTPKDEVLHWSLFNEDFYSTDLEINIDDFADDYYIDCRPYMIYDPFCCSPLSTLTRANDLFRQHHLRHCLVINPGNGTLVGILTRKDIFKWMTV